MIKKLDSLLAKYTNLRPTERFIKESSQVVIRDTIHISIPLSDIRVAGKTIFIEAPSSIKSEIMLQSTQILAQINEQLASYNKNIAKIR